MKKQTIELYRSALCPRCAYATKILKDLSDEFEDIEIITYDVVTNTKAFKNAGVIMVPTIKIRENKRSWLMPKTAQIRDFVLDNRQVPK